MVDPQETTSSCSSCLFQYDNDGITKLPYFASAADYTDFCESDVQLSLYRPRKLLYKIKFSASSPADVFKCPTTDTYNVQANWDKLFSAKFKVLNDHGTINLSKRFQLGIGKGPLPADMWDSGATATCASFGDRTGSTSHQFTASATNQLGRYVHYRVQDDEMNQLQNNAVINQDTSYAGGIFAGPGWEPTKGHVTVPVTNRIIAPGERSLVNVGVGPCLTEAEKSSSKTIKDVWESYIDQSTGPRNPLMENGGVFGDCDLLDGVNFPKKSDNSVLSNAEMFAAIFDSAQSLQMTREDYDDTFTNLQNSLMGWDHSTAGTCTAANKANCKNTLFTAPRDLGEGNMWNITKATMDEFESSDHTLGFQAELGVTLEKLNKCLDRAGNKVLSIQTATGTKYEFVMSTTVVTAMRKDDTNYVHWSPICTERPYEITVSNTMFAMGGIQATRRNDIYVDNMRYIDANTDGVCTTGADCTGSELFGPKNTCQDHSVQAHKAFEYTVHLDLYDVSNQITVDGTQRTETAYFGLAAWRRGQGEG